LTAPSNAALILSSLLKVALLRGTNRLGKGDIGGAPHAHQAKHTQEAPMAL
jgi:hypothetical protein